MRVILGKAGGFTHDEYLAAFGLLAIQLSAFYSRNEVSIAACNINHLGSSIVVQENRPGAIEEWLGQESLIHRAIEIAGGLGPKKSLFFRGNCSDSSDFLDLSQNGLGMDAWNLAHTIPMRLHRGTNVPIVSISMTWMDRMVQQHLKVPVKGQLESSSSILWRQLQQVCATRAQCLVQVMPRFEEIEEAIE